jgi:hypothetical protein
MSKAEDIRKRIASGELKKRTGGKGGPGAGEFSVLVISAEYTPGETNPDRRRGRMSLQIVGALDKEDIGKKFYDYFQTVHEQFMEEKLAEWLEYTKAWGIDDKYIYDRAETGVEMTQNLMTEINRSSVKGTLILDVKRVLREEKGPKGQDQYWNNFSNARLAKTPFKIIPNDTAPDSIDPKTVESDVQAEEVLTDATMEDVFNSLDKPAPASVPAKPKKVVKPATPATPSKEKAWQV